MTTQNERDEARAAIARNTADWKALWEEVEAENDELRKGAERSQRIEEAAKRVVAARDGGHRSWPSVPAAIEALRLALAEGGGS